MATEHDPYEDRISEGIRSLADDTGQLRSPPPNLWGRIERALDDEQDAPDLVPPPVELWDRIADEVRNDAPAAVPGSRRTRSWMVAVAAVAAVLLIVVAIVNWPAPAPASELVARADLSGQDLDPGGDSTGTADLVEQDGRWRVTVSAADLPDAPAGSYYEAWLLSAGADQVQSLGALKGDDTFAVPDGISIDDFPLVDVSIEPIDGNPAHSSKSVLRGSLESV